MLRFTRHRLPDVMTERMRFHADFEGGRSIVQDTLARFTRNCKEFDLPFAVIGGLAVHAHGDWDRVTEEVDIIMAKEHLDKFQQHCIDRGYDCSNSVEMNDTMTRVPINVFLAGGVPGSGKPEDTPVRFPFPAKERFLLAFGGSPYVSLPRLIELKLASGITGRGRYKDLDDVQVLIRVKDICAELAGHLDPSVRCKYKELWENVQAHKKEEMSQAAAK